MANFNNILFDSSKQTPRNLVYGLSASNNSFVIDTAGTVGSKTVTGILFNQITAGTANVSLSCGAGTTFRVASGYHEAQAALYYNDQSSTLFTINTTFSTTTQQTVTANGSFNTNPNSRRLWNLNG